MSTKAGAVGELLSPLHPGDSVSQCPLPCQECGHHPAQVQDTTTPLQSSSVNYLHDLLCALQLISCAAEMGRMSGAGG